MSLPQIAMSQGSETHEISIPDDVELEKLLKSVQQPEITDEGRGSKIQKVPPLLRKMQNNQSCYDPRVVSLGPYHHGKDELQALEKLKPGIAVQYVESIKTEAKKLYDSVATVSEEARKRYAESFPEKFNDKEFTRMMFLDACFVLQFLCNLKNLKLTPLVAAEVHRDLFLLENQIPLLVLKALFSCGGGNEADWNQMINGLLCTVRPPKMWKDLSTMSFEAVHLLELFRKALVGEVEMEENYSNKSIWSSYRSASELKTVGIYCKPSKSHYLTDIRFCSCFGIGCLHLPPIMIDDSTKSVLLNMVAYEYCPDNVSDNFQVTAYISFMDNIIDNAEDVKELRSKGILLNLLGSDQQVAELFNEIANELVPNPCDYAGVKDKIESHYRNKIKIWMATWVHTHFGSPWTVPAFLGALLALFLTAVQTYYQVFKS